ncbi:hypothetical protein LJC55_04100 [Eubacteriales bacterium OttesenSCG-928-N14]|nr:hypothetical protein [Eubacteriales bacterium OttesenSCG-928-N14]
MARIAKEQIAHDLTLEYVRQIVDFPSTEEEKTRDRLELTLKDMYISYSTAYPFLLRMLKEEQGNIR